MEDRRGGFVYIITNQSGTLYVGVTSDLYRRVDEHKRGTVPDFTHRYKVTRLVYYEAGEGIVAAIGREKEIKGWVRAKKLALIRSINPDWKDLSDGWPTTE